MPGLSLRKNYTIVSVLSFGYNSKEMAKKSNEKCSGDEHILFEGAKKCQCGELTKDEIIALRGCVGDEHVMVSGKLKCQCGEFTSKELEEVDIPEKASKVSKSPVLFIIGALLFLSASLFGLLGFAILYGFAWLWDYSKENDSMSTFWTIFIVFIFSFFIIAIYLANSWGDLTSPASY